MQSLNAVESVRSPACMYWLSTAMRLKWRCIGDNERLRTVGVAGWDFFKIVVQNSTSSVHQPSKASKKTTPASFQGGIYSVSQKWPFFLNRPQCVFVVQCSLSLRARWGGLEKSGEPKTTRKNSSYLHNTKKFFLMISPFEYCCAYWPHRSGKRVLWCSVFFSKKKTTIAMETLHERVRKSSNKQHVYNE